MVEAQTPLALPPAYAAAFDAFASAWTTERRTLGRAVLQWLLVNPLMNSMQPRRAGDELEWRLITNAEWDAMRLTLAGVIVQHTNDTLIETVLAIKDFHPTAYQHLPAEFLEQMETQTASR